MLNQLLKLHPAADAAAVPAAADAISDMHLLLYTKDAHLNSERSILCSDVDLMIAVSNHPSQPCSRREFQNVWSLIVANICIYYFRFRVHRRISDISLARKFTTNQPVPCMVYTYGQIYKRRLHG